MIGFGDLPPETRAAFRSMTVLIQIWLPPTTQNAPPRFPLQFSKKKDTRVLMSLQILRGKCCLILLGNKKKNKNKEKREAYQLPRDPLHFTCYFQRLSMTKSSPRLQQGKQPHRPQPYYWETCTEKSVQFQAKQKLPRRFLHLQAKEEEGGGDWEGDWLFSNIIWAEFFF